MHFTMNFGLLFQSEMMALKNLTDTNMTNRRGQKS